jgi:hypothetical protein
MFPKKGKTFPDVDSQTHPEQRYAAVIAAALMSELGDTHRAIKTVMRWTGTSERTVKNWFAGTSGPSGEHLIAIVRQSDAVFDSVMLLAGRNEIAAAKRLVDARDTLVAMLEIIVEMTASSPDAVGRC